MRYTKPEVLVLGKAIDAVQATHTTKGNGNVDFPGMQTGSAYEADE
jgi:hypothetical protein